MLGLQIHLNFASSSSSVLTQDVVQTYTIAVSAVPSNGGSVVGGGTFASGSSRTVTATANSGYTFVDWTENGAEVSTQASYTFTLSGNRNLVANFSGGNGNGLYVSPKSGVDAGVCPVSAPCATLNYALSVAVPNTTITILDGGSFGPIVITQPITINGVEDGTAQILANPSAQVGCIGALPAGCGLANHGYAVEITAGADDSIELNSLLMEAGANGAGALKMNSGGVLTATKNVFHGNGTATGPIVSIVPSGSSPTQVYMSHSAAAFNNSGGAILVAPTSANNARLHFNHLEVHHAAFGIKTDASGLASGSGVNTFVSESEFFSFTGSAVTALSVAGQGAVSSVYNNVNVLNTGGPAVNANGPSSTVILTDGTLSGNAQGVKVSNGATVITSIDNTIKGNGTDVNGALTAAPRR